MLNINTVLIEQLIKESEDGEGWKEVMSQSKGMFGRESLEWRRVDNQIQYRIVENGKPGDIFTSF